jgi:hypothetical protein
VVDFCENLRGPIVAYGIVSAACTMTGLFKTKSGVSRRLLDASGAGAHWARSTAMPAQSMVSFKRWLGQASRDHVRASAPALSHSI